MVLANTLAFFSSIVDGVMLDSQDVTKTEKTFKFSFHNRRVGIVVSVENNLCNLTYLCDNGFHQVSDNAVISLQDTPATIVAIVNDYMTA